MRARAKIKSKKIEYYCQLSIDLFTHLVYYIIVIFFRRYKKMDFEKRKEEHKKQFEFLDMFLGSMAECSDNNKYKCLKLEHIINNKMPELLKISDNELQEELALLLNILEQADKCINDILRKEI